MKRTIKIQAVDESGHKLQITAKMILKNGLTRSEAQYVALKVGRGIADVIRDLPHTGFGPENTQVNL